MRKKQAVFPQHKSPILPVKHLVLIAALLSASCSFSNAASLTISGIVFIHEGNTYSKVAVEKLFPRQYKKINIDLSPWAGNNSQADMAIWVNSSLENVEKKSSATGP